jgi:ubiquinone/menaquinone biosynthesis C-methylase UbiE
MTSEAHEKSKELWDEMAPGWERYRPFMWDMTKHVAQWLVDHVDAHEGDTILDLAGGPGDNGFLAATRVGETGKVIETDFAPEMVATAQRHVEQLGLNNVETRTLDAERIDLPEDSVDGIICRWGFMLMMDPQTALGECRRVLKTGRRLALSVWGGPEKNPWVTVTGMTMMQLGHQPGRDPFGPGGMFSMSDPMKLRAMVEGAGFTDVEVEEMPVVWRYASFDESWEFMTSVAGAIASAVKEFPAEQVKKLRSALEGNLKQYTTDSGIELPGLTINVMAS